MPANKYPTPHDDQGGRWVVLPTLDRRISSDDIQDLSGRPEYGGARNLQRRLRGESQYLVSDLRAVDREPRNCLKNIPLFL